MSLSSSGKLRKLNSSGFSISSCVRDVNRGLSLKGLSLNRARRRSGASNCPGRVTRGIPLAPAYFRGGPCYLPCFGRLSASAFANAAFTAASRCWALPTSGLVGNLAMTVSKAVLAS